MTNAKVVITDCNYDPVTPHVVFIEMAARLAKHGVSLTVDKFWSDDYLAADLIIGADPLLDNDKLLDCRILGQRTLNRRTRLDVALGCGAHVAPFSGPRNDRELDAIGKEWNTDAVVLKYDWSARRNGVFLWPLRVGERKSFPPDFDPACDVFMAFQQDDPQTYKIDTFAGVLLGAYVLLTRDMREGAWQTINQREHLVFEPDRQLAEEISRVSRTLLQHGAGYTSFDLMRSGDRFHIIEMNTSGVGTTTWNDWPEQYAAKYTEGILAALEQIELIPRYREVRDQALRLGNDTQAPELPSQESASTALRSGTATEGKQDIQPELAFLQTLAQSEKVPSHAMRDFISVSIRRLLSHAKASSPFYADRLNDVLRHDGTIDWSAWSRVPLLHRTDVSGNRQALLARTLPSRHGSVSHIHTSGTQYQPLTVSRSRLSFGVAATVQMRWFGWHQVPVADRMVIIGLDGKLPVQVDGTWAPGWVTGDRGEKIQIPLEMPIERQLEELRRLGPVWLKTRPSTLLQLALTVCENPKLKPDLLGVLTEGEILTGDHRRLCKLFLGFNPIDRYSLREVWDVALQCPASNNYHVQTEAVYTELLNERNEPCRRGETGRIVVTSLYNLAMPIIRYDTGDYAVADENFSRYSGHFCACGKRLLRLRNILGRERNLLQITRATGQHPDLDSQRVFELSGAKLWQLVELASDSFELRLCTARALSGDEKRSIAEHTRSRLASDVQVVIESANLSEMHRTRKFEMYLSELSEPGGQ